MHIGVFGTAYKGMQQKQGQRHVKRPETNLQMSRVKHKQTKTIGRLPPWWRALQLLCIIENQAKHNSEHNWLGQFQYLYSVVGNNRLRYPRKVEKQH